MSDVALLQTIGLSKRFGGLRALDDVNVMMRPGELLGLIGPNGSGKSTFVNLVSGVLRPDEGRVLLAGEDVTGLASHRISGVGIARTFQAVRLFLQSDVAANLRAAMIGHDLSQEESINRSKAALLRVGLEVDPTKSAAELGLYDQRRLELAMRLVSRPKLILLDEPVGGLNPAEIRSMIALIQSLRAECGILVIEHTMKVITSLADRVVVLVNGRVLIDDKPNVVLRDPAVIETYLGGAHA
jgi:branched-chain amino acid transport system ATP-binding protein